MSDFAVSSSTPTPFAPITDGGAQQDVSTDQGPLQSPPSLENVHLAESIPAALQGSYDSSSAVIESPQLQLTQQDITSLALLSQEQGDGNGPVAVNNTTASAVLAVFELYLQNQQKIETEYTNPGAPHQELTSSYQQKMIDAQAGNPLPFVAGTALGVNNNHIAGTSDNRGADGRNNHLTRDHDNRIGGSRANLLGRDSKHDPVRKAGLAKGIQNKRNPDIPVDVVVSTATYSNEEALFALRKVLSEVSTMNNLAIIEEQNSMNAQQRSNHEQDLLRDGFGAQQAAGVTMPSHNNGFTSNQPFVKGNTPGLSAGAVDTNSSISAEYGGQIAASVNQSNFAQALQGGLKTLSEVTKPLRQQPIKVG